MPRSNFIVEENGQELKVMWLKFIAVIIVTDYCVRCSSTTLEDPAEANSVTVGVILPDSVVTNKIVETAIENVERHIDNSSHSLSNINFRKVYWPRRLSPRGEMQNIGCLA